MAPPPPVKQLKFPSQQDCLKLTKAFALDWLVVILFIVGFALIDSLANPYQNVFFINDPEISYPTKTETFPNALLYVFGVALPIVAVWVIALARKSMLEFHMASLGIAFALTLTVLITEGLKNYMGGLRPDFLARCQPNWSLVSAQLANGTAQTVNLGGVPAGPAQMFDGSICTGNVKTINEGRKSFPSGHASISFTSLVFVSLYASTALGVYNRPDRRPTSLLFFAIALIPIVLAIFIAFSRIIDYRHHPWDVFWGSALGIVVAIWSYRHYFVPLIQEGEPAFRDRVDYVLKGDATAAEKAPLADADIELGVVDGTNGAPSNSVSNSVLV